MTTKEMRELDAWIDVEIFGVKRLTVEEMRSIAFEQWKNQPDCERFILGFDAYMDGEKFVCQQHFARRTDNSFGAMEVLKKCCIKIGSFDQLPIRWDDGQWVVGQDSATVGYVDESVICDESLETAICLFAKKLFTK